MADLTEHLEQHLGLVQDGATDPELPRINVVWFGLNRPYPGMRTLSTLGLSHHHLTGSGANHQELLLHVREQTAPPNAPAILFQVAGELIERGHGLRRGEVIGPRGRLFDQGECTALYATGPAYVSEDFGELNTGSRTIILVWLVPITTAEAEFVASHGWPAFEDLLAAGDPDLSDVSRPPLAGIHPPTA